MPPGSGNLMNYVLRDGRLESMGFSCLGGCFHQTKPTQRQRVNELHSIPAVSKDFRRRRLVGHQPIHRVLERRIDSRLFGSYFSRFEKVPRPNKKNQRKRFLGAFLHQNQMKGVVFAPFGVKIPAGFPLWGILC